ncbi:MAG: hypothetical protein Q8M43_02285 [Sulfuricurvum sp.]|uniref:hypothetical protein n=1 Tax=Sulfuricurvum sp. TaxID=2025608 RepID=UPI002737125A|nr:hypothetical protein [Sulfuricurvum sp.]MDP2849994.1 hypothetical protein [Sulfuricurvum sp.]MDP3290833.1 hypothetical protein [Sulfuricurvum sp.]
MKKILFLTLTAATLLISGCAQKQMSFNGMICPAGKTEDLIKADFQECRYYDLKAATEASKAPITVECQQCLENKGYKIEQ